MTTSRSVRKLMNEKLEKIMVSKTAQEAARKIGTVNTSSLIVTDLNEKPVGIITERDLVRRVVANNANSGIVLIEDIMASIITIDANSSVEAAADLMLQNKVRHLLVVENEDVNKPLGIITSTDFTTYLMEGDESK